MNRNETCRFEIRFFSDLDRTLIYSHRVAMNNPKKVVERLNGKAQSYMTSKTFDYFRYQHDVELIPVTTRTQTQYERITALTEIFPCKYALICNGGVLLVDGKEDQQWTNETRELISRELVDLENARAIAEKVVLASSIRSVHGMFFYFVQGCSGDTYKHLKSETSSLCVEICYTNRKVYCFPKSLNKGTAVKRFMCRYGKSTVFAAGDSEMDVSMLAIADYAFAPASLSLNFCRGNVIQIYSDILSDEICDYLRTIPKGESNDEQ